MRTPPEVTGGVLACDPAANVWVARVIAAWLCAGAPLAQASAPATAPDVTLPRPAGDAPVIVRSTAVDPAALRAELRTRWPDAELLDYSTAAFTQVAGRAYVYVEVLGETVGDVPVSIAVITSDGRGYVRQAVVGEGGRARVLAVEVAGLLAAAVDEDLPPDRTDLVVPTLQQPTPPQPPVRPPLRESSPPPGRASKPAPPPRATPEDDAVDEALPPEPRGWQLGPVVDASLLLGAAPRARRGAPDFAGRAGLDVRTPFGLAVGASVRLLGDSALEYRLVRTRLDVRIGYVGRVGALEYLVSIAPTFEPWRVRANGHGLVLASSRGRGRTVLWGAALRGAVGYAWRVPERGMRARVGLAAELAASALRSGAAARVREPVDGAPLFAIGGLEFVVGVEAALWFQVTGPRARAKRGARKR